MPGPAIHRRRLGPVAALLVILVAGCGRAPAPVETKPVAAPVSPSPTNVRGGFQAVSFDNRSNVKRSFLTSENVVPQPDGRPLIVKPRLTTYRDDGSVAWIAEPNECIFDDKARVASSPKDFHAFTADQRFDIRGVGFQIRLEDSHLFISNQVHTVIHRPPPTNAPAATGAPLEVFSDQFDYETGLAIYHGRVRADDPEGRLNCDQLTAQFAGANGPAPTNETRIETIVAETNVVLEQKDLRATGDRAVYTAADNTITITGHPAWRQGLREGRGDRLRVNRTTREMSAAGHVFMKLPRDPAHPALLLFSVAAAPTNAPAGANQPIEITADDLDYRPGSAVFRGHVRAGDASGTVTCQIMTVAFSETGNQVETIVAEREVVIVNLEDGSRATAARAVYTAGSNLVNLTGQPRWFSPQQTGRATTVQVDSRARSFVADGDVAVKLLGSGTNAPAPFLAMLSFSTNAPAPAKGPTQIFSDHLEFKADVAVFRGRVRVEDASGIMRCGVMTATFAEPANRIKTVVAEQQVDMEQAESQLTCGRLTMNPGVLVAEQGVEIFTLVRTPSGTNLPVNAIGTRAVYTPTNGLLELTGRPVLMTSQLTSTGEVLVLHRLNGLVCMKGLSQTVVNRGLLKRPGATNLPRGPF